MYGPTGKLALMNGQTVIRALVPLPAGATAVYTSGPTFSYFRHPDWLGSSRFASTASRTMYYSGTYAPFGENYSEQGTPDRSFTGQNQDTVQGQTTGLYDFTFREYAQYGRWISPDPAGLGAVNPANPQSWNRYAYVLNNPMNVIDPLGLDGCGIDDGTICLPGFQDLGGGPVGTWGGCTLDGFWSPCGVIGGLVAGGAAIQCPNNDCSAVGQVFAGQDGGIFRLIAAANGFVWVNALNGDELPSYVAAEAGLPDIGGGFGVFPGGASGGNGGGAGGGGSSGQCTNRVLGATNQQFGTTLNTSNIQDVGSGPLFGGAFNLFLSATNLPASQFNAIQPGRYPLNPITWLIGCGATLHVTGFSNSNVGGLTSVSFQAHTDSAFAYNPIGLLLHYIIDVKGSKTRNPCP